MEVEVLAARSLDHKPLWIRFSSRENLLKPQSFKFEACWNKDEECSEVIKTVWGRRVEDTNAMAEVMAKLESCKHALTAWSSSKYRVVGHTIKRLTWHIEKLQSKEHPGNLDSIKQLQGEIHHLMEMEDIRWKQRAKRNWYKGGD